MSSSLNTSELILVSIANFINPESLNNLKETPFFLLYFACLLKELVVVVIQLECI